MANPNPFDLARLHHILVQNAILHLDAAIHPWYPFVILHYFHSVRLTNHDVRTQT